MIALGLTAVLIVTALPSAALAGGQAAGSVSGIARGRQMQTLSGVKVQIRSAGSGQVVGSSNTTEGGAFSFSGLPAGDYVAEVVDATGKVQGVSSPFAISAGGSATTSVVALSYGAPAAASTGGFSFLGMGPVTTMTVLGAAAAASVVAVASTRPDASPSR
jgi:hypothetical protein